MTPRLYWRALIGGALLLATLATGGCGEDPASAPVDGVDGATVGDDAETAVRRPVRPPILGPGDPGYDPDRVLALEWDDLIPPEWQPEKLFADYDIDTLDDEDPRADELFEKLKTLWAEAPVVAKLDGQLVRLPGFVVPLDWEAEEAAQFLLVPYFGACIHVPPPPQNQTVLVVTPPDAPFRGGLFETVWVEGRLRVDRFSSELGDAGYRIESAKLEPYVEEE